MGVAVVVVVVVVAMEAADVTTVAEVVVAEGAPGPTPRADAATAAADPGAVPDPVVARGRKGAHHPTTRNPDTPLVPDPVQLKLTVTTTIRSNTGKKSKINSVYNLI